MPGDTVPLGIPTFGATNQKDTLADVQPDVAYQLLVLATVWDTTHDAVLLTDTANLIVAVNPAFQQITGYAESEAIGKSPAFLASGRHPESFFAAMWEVLGRHGQWEGEVLNRRKNGSVYPQWLRITVLRHPKTREVSNYLAVFADLSKQKAAQSQAMRLANFDQLTGLPNQVLLRDRVDQAIAQADGAAHKVALLVLDLDHFKAVNDSLGHAGGDNLLRRISVALTEAVGQTETVSRRGGDEFVLLFPRTDMAHVRLMAQRVLATFSDPFEVNGREAMVSASLGVSVFPADGGDYDTLLNHAEAAMYKAKEAGRRCVRFFTEEMNNQAARDRLTLLSELTRAPQRGELRLYYQPLVNLVTSEVIGAEALVRWERPGVGLVPPGVFIPLAESTGLITEIGEWVLNEACRQVRAWVDSGLGQIKVAVNVSALQFTQGVLEQQVNAALTMSGCDPQLLELELTESTLMVRPDEVAATVHRLKQRGVQLSIDDFGTGYSSLSYLRKLDIDKIKIDQSFVRDLTIDPDGAAIVRAIIQMAKSLGLRTLGEGVETQVNRRALQVLGCDFAQGYFFGRPLPAADFEAALRRNTA